MLSEEMSSEVNMRVSWKNQKHWNELIEVWGRNLGDFLSGRSCVWGSQSGGDGVPPKGEEEDHSQWG